MGRASAHARASFGVASQGEDVEGFSIDDIACHMGSRRHMQYKVLGNRRTSYECITGHKGVQPNAMFGEKVMFKYTTDKNRRNKMESE